MSDLLHAERQELVLLEDLVGTESQALKDQTRVALVLKPVQHPHTGTAKKIELKWHHLKNTLLSQ